MIRAALALLLLLSPSVGWAAAAPAAEEGEGGQMALPQTTMPDARHGFAKATLERMRAEILRRTGAAPDDAQEAEPKPVKKGH